MHSHKVNGIRADRFRSHDEVTGVAMFVIDQHDHATCFESVYCILNGIKLHDLSCPPLPLDCLLSRSPHGFAGHIIAETRWDVDNTTAAKLSREIQWGDVRQSFAQG